MHTDLNPLSLPTVRYGGRTSTFSIRNRLNAVNLAPVKAKRTLGRKRDILLVNNSDINVHSVVDEDGAVILDIERDVILRLNSTGGFIWGELQAGNSIRDIVLALAHETNTEIEAVEQDVREFLDDLKSKHLTSFSARLANAER